MDSNLDRGRDLPPSFRAGFDHRLGPRLHLAEPVSYRPNLFDREVCALRVSWL
ncbi:MAG TPA: hypothetical protein VFS26_02150 [Solirubrobacterales bacterium]|nr:hypothetical protein [Solirubrobacterales bacterium]